MTEFWEASFLEKQTMWGFEPSDSAILTKDFFLEKGVKDILIPGIFISKWNSFTRKELLRARTVWSKGYSIHNNFWFHSYHSSSSVFVFNMPYFTVLLKRLSKQVRVCDFEMKKNFQQGFSLLFVCIKGFYRKMLKKVIGTKWNMRINQLDKNIDDGKYV